MAKQYGFFVDSEKCIGCFTCAMACKNQYHQENGVVWRKVYPLKEEIYPHKERAFYSLACNHCENPACLNVCPAKAYYKRKEDGIVVHDSDRCIGCKNCIRSCPYGAPQYNPVLKKSEKCSLCYQRIDAGRLPMCVQSCPVDAIRLIDVAEPAMAGVVRFAPGFPKQLSLNPSVRFRLPEQPEVVRREKI